MNRATTIARNKTPATSPMMGPINDFGYVVDGIGVGFSVESDAFVAISVEQVAVVLAFEIVGLSAFVKISAEPVWAGRSDEGDLVYVNQEYGSCLSDINVGGMSVGPDSPIYGIFAPVAVIAVKDLWDGQTSAKISPLHILRRLCRVQNGKS